MNTITNLNTFPIGNTLDGVNIITEEISTLSLLVDGTNSMIADLNMDNHSIKNLDAGVDSLDAVNKSQLDLKADTSYVNTQLALKADKTYVDSSLNLLRTYTDAQLALKADKTYVDSSLNLLKTYTNTQLAFKADKTYVDSSLNLLRTYTNTQLALKADKTYVDSSLNLLRDTLIADINDLENYVDSSLNFLKSYVDTQDNLKVNKSGDEMSGFLRVPEVRLVGQTTTFNNNSIYPVDSGNRTNTYISFESAGADSDWAYLRQIGGSNSINLALDFHDDLGDGKFSLRSINSVSNPDATPNTFFYSSPSGTNINNLLTLNYINASLDIRATEENQDSILYLSTPYQNATSNRRKTAIIADGIGNWNRANLHFCLNQALTHNDVTIADSRMCIINSTGNVGIATTTPSERLDVNGSGIFRGSLNVSTSETSTNIEKQLNLETNSNGIWFNPYFSAGAWNPLVSNESKGIIFSKGSVDTGDLVIGPWSNNPNGIKINSTGEVFMNNNASTSNSSLTYSSSAILFINSSETLYNYYTMTISSNLQVFLPSTGTSDATMTNKLIYISIPNATTIKLLASGSFSNTINVNGTSASEFTLTPTYRQISILGSSTIGSYTINTSSNNKIPLSLDQLTIKSNLDTNNNSEFTGIRFLNTSTDAGYIRCETDREHNNSVMRFYSRSSNNIILPLEISNVITSHRPIIRKAFSDGELIKSKCYGGSGLNKTVSVGNGWVEIVSLTFTADENVGLDVCCFVINFNTSYYINGSAGDDAYSKVSDTTGTEQILQINRQRYTDANGGGTRSGTIFPVMTRYTPTQSLTNKTRTIKIYAKLTTDGITGDNLYISNNDNESANNWYAEIRQIYSP